MSGISPTDMAWSMLQENARNDKTGMMRTLMLESRAYEANQTLGPALPLALRPGQEAIQPAVLLSSAELLERGTPLVNLKG